MTFVQHRMPEKWHSLQNDFKILTLTKQLEHESIDNFIDFVDGNVLLVVNDICRRKMNMFLSIAERVRSKIKKTWPWADNRPTEEQLIRLFDMDEFANERELVREDILPFWKVEEFVEFFCVRVSLWRLSFHPRLLSLCAGAFP